MQTFLPFDNFKKSAECMDKKRLWKQCVEAMELIKIITGEKKSRWASHPACKMWKEYPVALKVYFNTFLVEWKRRGGNTSYIEFDINEELWAYPFWFGNYDFHRSHQSNLVRKKPDHYRLFFPDVPDNLPYVWPVS
jgi:hypothetical protein